MKGRPGSKLVAISTALALCAATAVAEEIVRVDRRGVMKRATKAKDREQRVFRLRKGARVLVESERGDWYWVRNKRGRAGWVKKRFVRLVKEAGLHDETSFE